ncbi:tetratricopeptide repeat protein [Halomonas sp. QX-2]|uniref:Tetratricopeptide repeat protein n=1 Tax=Vreelandella sedimenti TaxID=2729618 RepID=A0A7Z0SPJ0_9GAMM|nr:tetratricopeptide repeat protein [Halomonas sedimenti]NYT74348.1 tetratricopeptide repeat protein [Halomonas sedimenti]
MSDTTILICTGFHRSATSVTAQWLARLGLNMGHWMLGASPSNRDGHYEDNSLVMLQNQALAAQGTSWRFHDEVPLYPLQAVNMISRYSASRDQFSPEGWCVKDPRCTLFLPAWNNVLESRARYLFVLRHWSESIQSLYKRHAEALVFDHSSGLKEAHLQFWRKPTLALEMWIAYNRRLLDFFKKHPDQTLLISQRSIFSGLKLPEILNKRWNMSFDFAESPVKPHLLADIVDNNILSMCTTELVEKADKLWEELMAITDYKNNDESARWSNNENKICQLRNVSEILDTYIPTVIPIDLKAHLDWLETQAGPLNLLPVIQWLRSDAEYRFGLWEKLARLALKHSNWSVAIEALKHIVIVGNPAPNIFKLLADAYLGHGEYDMAIKLYEKAISKNKKNFIFYVSLSHLYMSLGRHEKAEMLLKKSTKYFDRIPGLLFNAIIDALWQQGKYNEAKDLLAARKDEGSILKLSLYEIEEGNESGVERLRKWRSRRLEFNSFESFKCQIESSGLSKSSSINLVKRVQDIYAELF